MKKFSIYLLFAFVAVLTAGLSSCSETDNEVEEFPNWQATNEAFFDKKYAEVKSLVDGGNKEWKVLRTWNLEANVATHSYDHVLVNVLNEGKGSGCPIYTDSVKVHYSGRLLPSTSYPDGYMFDKSWSGDEFNEATAIPATFSMGLVVKGFSTALMYMHIGDKWRVYIPHQLGYGSLTNPGAAYSTLVFDVELVAYYHANHSASKASAKGGEAQKYGEWIYE